jgi:D-alanyl-D-alanine carboxypeptidase
VSDGARRRHARRRRAFRRRRLLVAGAASLAVIGGVIAYTRLTGPLIEIPDDPCTERPPLQEVDGVRLQPVAMEAFVEAQQEAGTTIPVVQSYRSCGQQRMACRNICGDPLGCPGLCAPPGRSWHQLGAAIDITQEGLDTPGILAALEANGWCQSVPDSDPGHFSFDGCH